MRKADSKYGQRFGIGMGSYAVLLVVALLVTRAIPDSPWRFVVMALPAAALFVVVWAMLRYVREADELQSRKLLEGLAIGFAGGSVITFTWGLMQTVGAPDVNWMAVLIIYAACWLIGSAVSGRRYS